MEIGKGLTLTELEKTCQACPSQWEGRLDDGRHVYVRYRWGTLQVGVGDTPDAAIGNRKAVWDSGDEYHGVMDTDTMLSITGLKMKGD